ncbi:MAG TPA: VOC family protein [Polyangiaceae bacterium]|nr:VOC family protein [Polyangiaceae bacterium]
MKLKVMTLYVDDQDRALAFYTEKLGFQKKTDVGGGGYRWLTVVSPEQPDGPELQLAPNASPVAKAYQQGLHGEGTPAVMFFVNDVEAEHARISKLGVKFTMPVTKTPGSRIARLNDTCGNVIQLTQLEWG